MRTCVLVICGVFSHIIQHRKEHRMSNLFVRADHFENGLVIPILYSIDSIDFIRIDRVKRIEKSSSSNCVHYLCVAKNQEILLKKQNDIWYLVE